MSDIAIRVENLSKKYRIGPAQQQHDTLRDALMAAVKSPIERLRRDGHEDGRDDEIWALKDVSFEVKRGEVLGIIGRNGAGKSTLLKILSRITQPTDGRAVINGRVRSLLEVGTGFHPELTGRENIYLNGAILGMTRAEIERKYDEIVDFSGVEKFIDTPVKRYSSGMRVRLAFAVAAHLDPEILLIDEVLAVGDAEFQKKCLGKMGDVASEGKTVLFVSHNMAAVAELCGRAVWLDGGRAVTRGVSHDVVDRYLAEAKARRPPDAGQRVNGSAKGRILGAAVLDCRGESTQSIRMSERLVIHVDFRLHERVAVGVGVSIVDRTGKRYCSSYTPREGIVYDLPAGEHRASLDVPRMILGPGEYFVTCSIRDEPHGEL
ncbi:MAG: ABC transporter ATP-binding protein, partial [Chloroflexota bacterium]|nr:ABC transporter ATP-binding protein [Chloroflexota bacterium]